VGEVEEDDGIFFFSNKKKRKKNTKKKNAKKGRNLPLFFAFAFVMKHSSCLLLSTFVQC
jgi:hypothetical protein